MQKHIQVKCGRRERRGGQGTGGVQAYMVEMGMRGRGGGVKVGGVEAFNGEMGKGKVESGGKGGGGRRAAGRVCIADCDVSSKALVSALGADFARDG